MSDTIMLNLPPNLDLACRPLQPADLGAIGTLTSAVLAADGGLPLAASSEFIHSRYLSAPVDATIGAFDRDGMLVACAAAQVVEAPQESRATIVGQVHPSYRHRGLGEALLASSIAQARQLLAACPPDCAHVLGITTESLTEPAARLYARHGFAQIFGETVMRRDLSVPLPEQIIPPEMTLATWAPERAGQFFEAYQDSFRERPGFPGWRAEQWIEWVTEDEDFLPELSLLVCRGDRPLGFVVCAEGWIVQVGVRPEARGRGLASALVAEALRRFRAAGAAQVMLDVNLNNPKAERVYGRLGFEVFGRRARFEARMLNEVPYR